MYVLGLRVHARVCLLCGLRFVPLFHLCITENYEAEQKPLSQMFSSLLAVLEPQ